jgi:serpin B
MKRALSLLPLISATLLAADDHSVPAAINALGLDLYRAQAKSTKGNLLLSPYSIQTALAMTYAGADGATREEMHRVLHFPADEEAVHTGFGAITRALNAAMEQSKGRVAAASERGGPSTPIEIDVANRLFGQSGFEFKAPFLATLKDRYDAPLEMVDFSNAPEQSRSVINEWVAKATKEKIREIIPPGALDADTRLTLANAIYFRAGWAREFSKDGNQARAVPHRGKEKVDVPTMLKHGQLGYKKGDAFTGVTVGYEGDQLQLLVILQTIRLVWSKW